MTMIPDITRDPPRDAELADAMAGVYGALPARPAELDRLRSAIVAGAKPGLALLAQPPRVWWEVAAGWSRAAVPLAAAAGVALAMLIGNLPDAGTSSARVETLPDLEEVLAVSLPQASEALFIETFTSGEP
jgi:negative regulator of sigma E activity